MIEAAKGRALTLEKLEAWKGLLSRHRHCSRARSIQPKHLSNHRRRDGIGGEIKPAVRISRAGRDVGELGSWRTLGSAPHHAVKTFAARFHTRGGRIPAPIILCEMNI